MWLLRKKCVGLAKVYYPTTVKKIVLNHKKHVISEGRSSFEQRIREYFAIVPAARWDVAAARWDRVFARTVSTWDDAHHDREYELEGNSCGIIRSSEKI